MIDARFVPIEKWPGAPTKSRKYAHFRASYSQTLDLPRRSIKRIEWPRENFTRIIPTVAITVSL